MREDHGIVALIKHGEKFLLLKDSRDLMLDFWAPPHGRCDISDATEEITVIREVLEETALEIKPLKKIWTTQADTKVKTVSFWLAEHLHGEIKIDPKESSEYGWFTLDETLNLKLYPGTHAFFTLFDQGELSL